MPHSFGRSARTRSKFARGFRAHGPLHLSKYFRVYKLGEYVDIKTNGGSHRGMPHRVFHGKTGKIWNVTPRAVGIIVNKRVKHRIFAKKLHVRIEHVNPSSCQNQHKQRVKDNDKAMREYAKAKKEGKAVPRPSLKRAPGQPLRAHFVSVPKTGVETVTPQRFVTVI